jgi:hypothetical protein
MDRCGNLLFGESITDTNVHVPSLDAISWFSLLISEELIHLHLE